MEKKKNEKKREKRCLIPLIHSIHTDCLLIRPYDITDAADKYNKLDSDTHVTEYTGGIKSRERSLENLKRILDVQKQTVFVPRAVVLRQTNELIGWCGLWPFLFDRDTIEISFGIARSHWGNGYATEAAKALLDAAFCEYELDLIVAAVNPHNTASERVVHKLGLVYLKKIDWPGQGLVNYYHLSKLDYMK